MNVEEVAQLHRIRKLKLGSVQFRQSSEKHSALRKKTGNEIREECQNRFITNKKSL